MKVGTKRITHAFEIAEGIIAANDDGSVSTGKAAVIHSSAAIEASCPRLALDVHEV